MFPNIQNFQFLTELSQNADGEREFFLNKYERLN